MTALKIVLAIVLSAAFARAQEIPAGTALPVWLNSAIDAKTVLAGQAISGSIAQDVPLPSGGKLRAGARVSGQVLQAGMKGDGRSYVRLRFDRIHAKDRDIAITTSLRALASPREVDEAQLPKVGPVLTDAAASWITTQVGDDVVYRGGGHVMHDAKVVGDPVKGGVLAELLPVEEPGCTEGSEGRRLALWIFSSSACGAYGFGRFDIAHPGNTAPMGEIVLETRKNVRLGTGSGLLLITEAAPQASR